VHRASGSWGTRLLKSMPVGLSGDASFTDYSFRFATHSVYSGHAHTHAQLFNSLWYILVDYPGRPVPEETLTHSHPSWSSDILYQLPPFTTIHSILCVQFTSLTVLCDNLFRSSLVFLLALDPLLHTACISSPIITHLFLVGGVA